MSEGTLMSRVSRSKRIDRNRYSKTYPFLHRIPNYSFVSNPQISYEVGTVCFNGNDTITYNGFYYYSDLFIRFKFLSLLREFKREFKYFDKGLLYIVKHQLLIPLAQYVKFTYSAYKYQRLFKAPQFIKSMRRDGVEKKRFLNNEISFLKHFYTSNTAKRENQLERNIDFLGNSWYLKSNHLNVQVTDPSSDLRLINFLISIPQNLFFRNGIHKNLFRALMKGKLPDSILWNNKYQYQSFDFAYRLAVDKEFALFFNDMLSLAHRNELFNANELLNTFKTIAESPSSYLEKETLLGLLRNFSLYCFCFYNKKR